MSMEAMRTPLKGSQNRFRHKEIQSTLQRRYESRLINNVDRGAYVECMLAKALGAQMPWDEGRDWEAWDLELKLGKRKLKIEVKQAAAMQTWHLNNKEKRTHSPRFSIAPKRAWNWKEGGYRGDPDRHADVYIFCWHPEKDQDIVDHRCIQQWKFFIVATADLPPGKKTIGLQGIEDLGHSSIRLDKIKETLHDMDIPIER